MASWRRFFTLQLPLAMLVLAIIAQALAFALSRVTLDRHRVDELAAEAVTDDRDYPVVLIGDSVTSKISIVYRIGKPGQVADLSTHGDAGMASELLLLRRFLQSGHRPRYLVIAASPDFLTNPAPSPGFNYWLYSVFRHPDERQFLQAEFPAEIPRWKPAIMDITGSIVEPIISLFRPRSRNLVSPSLVPRTTPGVENNLTADAGFVDYSDREKPTFALPAPQRDILESICKLSSAYGFKINFVWAPTEATLLRARRANGYARSTQETLGQIFEHCAVDSYSDMNDLAVFPYFDKDSFHIRGEGWKELYARQLSDYIERLVNSNIAGD